jgi:hypothetical protein
MKKLLLILMSITAITKADEGMWMPQLIAAMNFADMKANGFKLTAEQIYSVNKSSMKDAVILFGGGCTAEVISGKGLILTNHHCGFSAIAGMSTVQKDYLKNGFWAMNANEEMYCKDLTVTFIKNIEDVTAKILASVKVGYTEFQRDSAIHAATFELEKKLKDSGKDGYVKPFYYGNEFYMFTTETFKDIRLVGAPPESIGKFGAETDNWMWPRHNADFSMFRIYASKDNKPAAHSSENVPYKPAYSFPISVKGVEKGDFTMVYGFPGRTQEYLTSYAVDFIMNRQDPLRVDLRGKRLEIIEADMKKNDTLRLMYTGRHASVANYFKKWDGEMQGLKRSGALEKKKEFENKLEASLMKDQKAIVKLSDLMREFKLTYMEYTPLAKQADLYNEGLVGIDAIRMLTPVAALFDELKLKKEGKENKFDSKLKESTPIVPFANFNKETDRKLCKAMLMYYIKSVEKNELPKYLDSLVSAYDGNILSVTNYLYDNSVFVDNKKAGAAYANFEANAAELAKDPMIRLTVSIEQYFHQNVLPKSAAHELKISVLQREYMKLLREMVKNKKFYPDANSTMRVAYGKVNDYKPRDGVEYGFYTTLDGLVEKYKSGKDDYFVMPRLLELYEKKDFGTYADKNGKMRVAFIGSNHTTGGNSGSPVLNANGELIGTNFDRDWEGTMSDIMYNPAICRNITLDVRYTLWIIDKYAGAGYLLKEMKIVK